jgi:hypothetical protein
MVKIRLTTFLVRPWLSKQWAPQAAYASLAFAGAVRFADVSLQWLAMTARLRQLDCVETVFSHHFLICVPLLHERDSCESLP